MNNTNTAQFIKKIEGTMGDARLYRLSPPAPYGTQGRTTAFAFVSTAIVEESIYTQLASIIDEQYGVGAETAIFPCDEEGNVTSWKEMGKLLKGELDHEKALAQLGYQVQ